MSDRLMDMAALTAFALGLLLIFLALLGAFGLGCDARWGDLAHEWSPLGGCRVLSEYGYVPESNFRLTIDGITFVADR